MKIVSKLLILLGAVFLANVASAQYRPKLADEYLKKLQKQGIDTILIYMTGCGECTLVNSNPNCDCSLSDVIQTIHFIYLKNKKTYKFNLSCCREDHMANDTASAAIPYFISLKEMFRRKDAFYKNLKNNKRFIVLMPTDNPFDDVELIIGAKHISFTSYLYQRYEYHKTWSKYFWVNKELKLVDLIRSDLSLSKL